MLLNADGKPLHWQVRKNGNMMEHIGVGYSDHLPLVFDVIVTSEGNPKSKITVQNPSTTESGPNQLNPDVIPVCGPRDSYISLKQIDFDKGTHFNQCVKDEVEKPVISNMGYEAVVNLKGKTLVVTMTRSFGENKSHLRNVIQRSAGKPLKRIVGRIGWHNGNVAVFAHTPSDISIGD